MERSIEALQEVEPLKRLEHNLQLTLTWQHVRCLMTHAFKCIELTTREAVQPLATAPIRG